MCLFHQLPGYCVCLCVKLMQLGTVMSEADSVPVSPSLTMGSSDIREMSFQNVVDRILRPSGIKMGGFPLEMFLDLSDAEQQKFMCNIW